MLRWVEVQESPSGARRHMVIILHGVRAVEATMVLLRSEPSKTWPCLGACAVAVAKATAVSSIATSLTSRRRNGMAGESLLEGCGCIELSDMYQADLLVLLGQGMLGRPGCCYNRAVASKGLATCGERPRSVRTSRI